MKNPVYLYRHFNANNDLLYIGISVNAVARTSQHKNVSWFGEICTIKIKKYSTRNYALKAEKNAIKNEKPKYNKIHNIINDEMNVKADNFDFHFVVDKTPSMRKFVDEASKEDRPIAAQFRRIIEERYSK